MYSLSDSTHSSSNVEIRGLQHMEARILREIKTGEKKHSNLKCPGSHRFPRREWCLAQCFHDKTVNFSRGQQKSVHCT